MLVIAASPHRVLKHKGDLWHFRSSEAACRWLHLTGKVRLHLSVLFYSDLGCRWWTVEPCRVRTAVDGTKDLKTVRRISNKRLKRNTCPISHMLHGLTSARDSQENENAQRKISNSTNASMTYLSRFIDFCMTVVGISSENAMESVVIIRHQLLCSWVGQGQKLLFLFN